MPPQLTVFYGTFVDLPRIKSNDRHELSVNHGALWVSSASGRIEGFDWSISSEAELQALMNRNGWVGVNIVRAQDELNEFFFPGFIDTHIHAPQYPNSGLFGSSTLLDWLETYTFPLESSLSNLSKARTVYNRVISRTLANGTTFASYFATIHVPATNLLATLCHTRGQRALIGRVCMENPSFCPDYYRDASPEDSISATKETITHIHSLDPSGTLVKPILTPRFAPTCSRESLAALGSLAASHSPPLHIQTHISENKDEVALVHSLFPESPSYAAVYDTYSLLTPRTILAHAIHLSPSEQSLIATREAKVSHCPASNAALGSGLAPVRAMLDAGITLGLGTDVSGGYSPSILEAVRQACLVSRLLRHTNNLPQPSENNTGTSEKEKEKGREVLPVEEALYLATRGGAAVVDMANDLGGFERDMFFDAQLIRLGRTIPSSSDPTAPAEAQGGAVAQPQKGESDSTVDIFGWESWTEKVHKWVWTGSERNVRAVWVGGSLVHSLDDEQPPSDSSSLASVFTAAAAAAAKGNVWNWAGAGLGVLAAAAAGVAVFRGRRRV
ncbi:hypothetical protein BJX61DRAFT_505871 [Aspergillus egyptiacus]|nr:hypothetical protein BJX61DRAFT_505871 [Aspergillus egyptiacus]